MTDEDAYDDDEGFPEKPAEMCYVDKDGTLKDEGMHDAMLDNPEAYAAFQQSAYEQAIAIGFSEEEARALYLTPKGADHGQRAIDHENKPRTIEERWTNTNGIGVDNDGNVNVIGFDEDYAPGGPKDHSKKG